MAILTFLTSAPVVDALSAIHDVIRSIEFRFDRERFDKLIKSKYSDNADSPVGDLAVRIRNEFEKDAGSDLIHLRDEEKNRLTVELATVAQELAQKSFGSDPAIRANAVAALEAFRKETF